MLMTPIRTLLVDDEPIARQVLREELESVPDVEVIGEAPNGVDALQAIEALRPDLVLLDLQMPGMDGFEVVRSLNPQPGPLIVIVTAFDQHAIQAFEAGAVDYLLKPVGTERLQRCLDRVRQLRSNPAASASSIASLREIAQSMTARRPSKIVGKIGDELHLLDSSQVLAFQAERELVWILTRKQRYLATLPLKALQEKLAGLSFARVHRNALVNLDHVAKMSPLSSQRWLITLDNQLEFVVSKRQAKAIQHLLHG